VPSENAAVLADAILRIAQDRPLRERLIAEGVERARRTTVEDFADALFSEVMRAMQSEPVPKLSA
jgi:hypothetical protein